jgi:hypothetical protein
MDPIKPPGGIAYRCSISVTETLHTIECMHHTLKQEATIPPTTWSDG